MSWLGNSWPFRCKVIVNLKAQPDAYRGILWEQRGGWLVLKNAEVLRDRQAPVPVDGDLLIDRRDVLFVQVPPGVQEP
jgi:hypothetical protein